MNLRGFRPELEGPDRRLGVVPKRLAPKAIRSVSNHPALATGPNKSPFGGNGLLMRAVSITIPRTAATLAAGRTERIASTGGSIWFGTGSAGCARSTHARLAARPGFSLIDVLVSIAVVGMLIALMIPTLQTVKERAHRAICQSNLRQIGLGVAMYAQDHEEFLPPSVFVLGPERLPGEMMTLKLSETQTRELAASPRGWDGLGLLYGDSYLNGPKVFYCPSHHGRHPYDRYDARFGIHRLPGSDPIVSNYHFRGRGPNEALRLNAIRPQRTALVADGMQTPQDFNHVEGSNVLRADMSLFWFGDGFGALTARLAEDSGGQTAQSPIVEAWELLDGPDGGLPPTPGGN